MFSLRSILLCAICAGLVVSCSKKEGEPAAPVVPGEKKAPEKRVFHPSDRIPVKIPAGQKLVSVVVDNADGVRVRNLLSMQPVEKFGGNPDSGQEQTLTVSWDGKDDDGKAVPAGDYHIRGLSLEGLDALYEYSFYNPGNTPWHGYANSHWGSNHGDPVSIAAVPNRVNTEWAAVVSCNGSEGTDYVFVIGRDGKKKWGLYQAWGVSWGVDVEGDIVYLATGNGLRRLSAVDGKSIGWKRPAGTITELKAPAAIFSVAIGKDEGALSVLPDDKHRTADVWIFDKEAGRTNAAFVLPGPMHLSYSPDGTLYATDREFTKLVTLDKTGVETPVTLPGLEKPGPMSFDDQGNLYILDRGADYQIKVYSPAKELIRTIGVKGGAKQGVAYDKNGFHNLLSLSVDDQGNLWTSEGAHPRRQALWDREGKLLKEFVGSTYYGAWNSTLHSHDTKRGFIWNNEFEIDPAQTQSYRMKKFTDSGYRKDAKLNLHTAGVGVWFHRNDFFRSDVSGQPREYMLYTQTAYPVVMLEKNGDYRPVAAVWTKSSPHPVLTPWSRPSDPDGTIYVWSDLNEDEEIQENEVVVIEGSKGRSIPNCMFPMSHELDFYNGGYAIRPTRFLPSGAPVYEMSTITKMELKGHDQVVDSVVNDPNNRQQPDHFMVRVGDHLYSGYGDWPYFFTGKQFWTDLKGNIVATRKTLGGGVHGSMAIGMVPQGEMTGELYVTGTAKVNDEVGTVMSIHGNYGQVYFLTEDGIFISSMFKDARDNPEGWGDKVERGKSWKNISMMQEAFCGWFGKQDDGKYRYLMGHTSANVVEITGLDRVKRFDAGWVKINPPPAQ
ncbi:hypothetical protein QQ056_19630 [Oscillatoria laete-virens NRMC-F 0139]|nr:hypothetical protein [Oscillatoria laete-virens NRMC-F 0139]